MTPISALRRRYPLLGAVVVAFWMIFRPHERNEAKIIWPADDRDRKRLPEELDRMGLELDPSQEWET